MANAKPFSETQILFLLSVLHGHLKTDSVGRLRSSWLHFTASTMDSLIRGGMIQLAGTLDPDRKIRLTAGGKANALTLAAEHPQLNERAKGA